jgi:hypothetical protein
MAGILEHFGFSLRSHMAAHGARPDLDLVIDRLTPDEIKAQREAWQRVRADYERLGRNQRTNLLTLTLAHIGTAMTLLGGCALLVPAIAFIGGPATVVGVVAVFVGGGWNMLNCRRRQEIAAMLDLCARMSALIEAAWNAR